MFTVFLLAFSVLLYSCGNSAPKEQIPVSKASGTVPLKPMQGISFWDTLTYDTLQIPSYEDTFMVDVLLTGSFHDGEVPANAQQKVWFGLFKGKAGYYLSPTTVKTKRVQDEILDMGDEKTGWEVNVNLKDSCLLLLSGVEWTVTGSITSIPLPAKEIYPGDTVRMSFAGNTYKLFATGGRETFDATYIQVWNYKLFLSAEKDGKEVTQLLMATPVFDDIMADILFVGDIDGDQRPDFIINTTNHYNVFAPTLYLSSMAQEGELLKLVGRHVSTGC